MTLLPRYPQHHLMKQIKKAASQSCFRIPNAFQAYLEIEVLSVEVMKIIIIISVFRLKQDVRGG